MTMETPREVPTIQHWVSVLWPSFIMAGIATILTFAYIDPGVLLHCGPDEDCRMRAYSIGFFFYWALTGFSSFFTCFFLRPCENFNKQKK